MAQLFMVIETLMRDRARDGDLLTMEAVNRGGFTAIAAEASLLQPNRHPLSGAHVKHFGSGEVLAGPPRALAGLMLQLAQDGPKRVTWMARVRFPQGEANGWLQLQSGAADASAYPAGMQGGVRRVDMAGLELDADKSVVVGGWAQAVCVDQLAAFSIWGSVARQGLLLWAAVSQA